MTTIAQSPQLPALGYLALPPDAGEVRERDAMLQARVMPEEREKIRLFMSTIASMMKACEAEDNEVIKIIMEKDMLEVGITHIDLLRKCPFICTTFRNKVDELEVVLRTNYPAHVGLIDYNKYRTAFARIE